LLEYEGAELLLIAARVGEGLETRLGGGRGDGKHASLLCYVALKDSKTALRDVEKKESEYSIDEMLRERFRRNDSPQSHSRGTGFDTSSWVCIESNAGTSI
jgi:hypothetical protein